MNSEATKRELAAALKEQMARKPLARITIKELTDRCGLRRATFYYHFEDIYALVKWMFQEEAMSLLEEQQGSQIWTEGLLQLFQYIQDNRAVCLCALNSLGREHLMRFFEADIHALIYRTVEEIGNSIGITDTINEGIDMELLTHFYVAALVGLLESWLLEKINHTPEELVTFVDVLLQDHIRGATLRIKSKAPCEQDLPNAAEGTE